MKPLSRRLIAPMCVLLALGACQPKRKTMPVTGPPPEPLIRAPTPKPLVPEQPVRPAENPRLALVMDTLWSSDLGKTYYDYLYGDPENHATSRDVVDRVLRDGGSAVTKLSAVQLLTEQLYDKHLIGPKEVNKLLVLQGDIRQRQDDLAKSPTEHMAYIAIGTFLTLIPFGFPAARSAILKMIQKLPMFLQPRSIREATPGDTRFSVTSFEPRFVIGTFFKYFGPFSMLYFAWFDWKESTRGHSIPYSLELLKNEVEFINFLNDLYKL